MSEIKPVAWTRIERGMRIYYETPAFDDLDPLYDSAALEAVRAEERERWLAIVRRAASIMAGGEGVQDQGEAYDRTLRLLDDVVREYMTDRPLIRASE